MTRRLLLVSHRFAFAAVALGLAVLAASCTERRASTADENGIPMEHVLRTPDHRFENLADYPFTPRYATVAGFRIHYIDEGPRDAAPVVLLHGEPSWSYLYRKIIPALTAAGHRVVAPDLVGFGRSDKPVEQSAYTYQRHVDWMRGLLLDELNLRRITLFGQDWGGLIGLRLVGEHPDRFARVVASNTGLPAGQSLPKAFEDWRTFSQQVPELPIGEILQRGTVDELPAEVLAAYDAPFPDERYKAGARVFPMLVPTSPDDPAVAANLAAWQVLSTWDRPFLTLFSDSDPITAGLDQALQSRIPGAAGQPHRIIQGAGHFVQEDRGDEIAEAIIAFIADTRQ
jgi:haloalkane dehalogenase